MLQTLLLTNQRGPLTYTSFLAFPRLTAYLTVRHLAGVAISYSDVRDRGLATPRLSSRSTRNPLSILGNLATLSLK